MIVSFLLETKPAFPPPNTNLPSDTAKAPKKVSVARPVQSTASAREKRRKVGFLQTFAPGWSP
jgi:hypothetical protein